VEEWYQARISFPRPDLTNEWCLVVYLYLFEYKPRAAFHCESVHAEDRRLPLVGRLDQGSPPWSDSQSTIRAVVSRAVGV